MNMLPNQATQCQIPVQIRLPTHLVDHMIHVFMTQSQTMDKTLLFLDGMELLYPGCLTRTRRRLFKEYQQLCFKTMVHKEFPVVLNWYLDHIVAYVPKWTYPLTLKMLHVLRDKDASRTDSMVRNSVRKILAMSQDGPLLEYLISRYLLDQMVLFDVLIKAGNVVLLKHALQVCGAFLSQRHIKRMVLMEGPLTDHQVFEVMCCSDHCENRTFCVAIALLALLEQRGGLHDRLMAWVNQKGWTLDPSERSLQESLSFPDKDSISLQKSALYKVAYAYFDRTLDMGYYIKRWFTMGRNCQDISDDDDEELDDSVCPCIVGVRAYD